MREIVTFLKANPQVFVLLIICLVLGLGTFLIVIFGVATSGNGQATGEPSGSILSPALRLVAAVWPA